MNAIEGLSKSSICELSDSSGLDVLYSKLEACDDSLSVTMNDE